MKLVEIKDVRVGQIWDNGNNFLIITGFSEYEPEMVHSVTYVPEDKPITLKSGKKVAGLMYSSTSKNSLEGSKLIGKLGITHRIEDGKLVEIPRTAEFQIDDVCYTLSFYNTASPHFDIGVDFEDIIFVIDNMDTYENGTLLLFDARGNEYRPDDVEKIGILGVTHEFVNDREA